MTSETFEQVLTAAQADGSFGPAWKKFVNTKFFVPVVRGPESDPRKVTLQMAAGAGDGAQLIRISEVRERLEQPHGGTLATLSGADVVRMLHAEADILVALSDRAFNIARERVEWLKKGIEASQARAAAKALEAAAPAPAPAPAPRMPAAPPPPVSAAPAQAAPAAPAKALPELVPITPPARVRRGQVLDVAALKPRSVSLARIGLDFFVPGAWRDVLDPKGLRFVDEAEGITLVASGMHRPDTSLAQWQTMRLNLVEHEMRYLTQDGPSYEFDGDNWRSRIKASATEFTGTFPGDDFPSRYLVAVIHTEGTVATLAIRAPADAFEDNRALFKWLLGRIDIRAEASLQASVPVSGRGASGAAGSAAFGDDGPPGVVGLSLRGRISRLQAMAYSFAVFLPVVVVSLVLSVIPPKSMVALVAMMGTAMVITLWFALRLMVLRLHDCNRSGKWIIFIPALALVFGLLRLNTLMGWTIGVFWILTLVFYCLVPGTEGDNDFGDQPDDNTGWVKFGAALFVALQLGGVFGGQKMMHVPGAGFRSPMGLAGGDGGEADMAQPFSPPDHSYMVTVPGTPRPMPSAPGLDHRLYHYQLQSQGRLYVMQSLDYGRTLVDRYGVMDQLQAEAIGKDGTLISSKPVFLRGLKGREVWVQLPNGVLRGSRFVITDTQMCNVVVVAAQGDRAAMEAFLASFMLL